MINIAGKVVNIFCSVVESRIVLQVFPCRQPVKSIELLGENAKVINNNSILGLGENAKVINNNSILGSLLLLTIQPPAYLLSVYP
jgi:hypothetical protein